MEGKKIARDLPGAVKDKKLKDEKIWQRLINMMNALGGTMMASVINGVRYTVYDREGTALRMEKTKKKVSA